MNESKQKGKSVYLLSTQQLEISRQLCTKPSNQQMPECLQTVW